jgi:phosphoribosylformylglycinamidine cyclo-ligase
MFRTFNMGIGMVLAVPADQADSVLTMAAQHGESAYRIGAVTARAESEPEVVFAGADV